MGNYGPLSNTAPAHTEEGADLAEKRHWRHQLIGRQGLGADVKVIITPPCVFCMENH